MKAAFSQRFRNYGLATLGLLFSLSSIAESEDPMIGGNRIPDTYLSLSSPLSASSSASVLASYWDEECVTESCRQSGYLNGETRVTAVDGTVLSSSDLDAFKKYKVGHIQCTGAGCRTITEIILAK